MLLAEKDITYSLPEKNVSVTPGAKQDKVCMRSSVLLAFAQHKLARASAGPDRKLFLPSGLLDRSEVPEYLNGELAGE